MIFKGRDSQKYFQSLSPARISQKKNNFNETNFERGRNRKMPNRKSQQSQSAPDNGKSQLIMVMISVSLASSDPLTPSDLRAQTFGYPSHDFSFLIISKF